MATVENPYDKVRRKMVAARIEFMGQLAKFSKEELTKAPADGSEWTPLQIAYHLYIADGLALEQMQLIQNRTRAAEPPASLDAVLAGMAARREEVFQYLSELPVDDWERPFRHPTWGQLKFYQMVNILPQHDKMHTQQLVDIKAAANR